MIITIAGKAGSGKSTIAKLLAKKLKLKHYSSGDFVRQLAKKRGIALEELSRQAENDPAIDEEIDERTRELNKEDNFVIDSRLASFFISKEIVSIFLDADEKERARRILKDNRSGESAKNPNEMIRKMHGREESERKRYQGYYGFDCYDTTNYDFVIDTTSKKPEDIVAEIMAFIGTIF